MLFTFFHPSTAEKVLLGWFFIVSLINVNTFVKIWKFRKLCRTLSYRNKKSIK